MKILSDIQENILQRECGFLHDLRGKLESYSVDINDLKTLDRSISQLDDLFLLVVVGEFNAGKSAVINALLGEKKLKEGVTPTTSQINILRFGAESERHSMEEGHEVITMPVALLSEVSIVDTPGTNAIIRQHEELTRHFVPRADLVLFITSVDRPFTESERQFMGQIRDWGKKVVIVLNKIDLLQDEEELAQVQTFVSENARNLLGITPEIFPVVPPNTSAGTIRPTRKAITVNLNLSFTSYTLLSSLAPNCRKIGKPKNLGWSHHLLIGSGIWILNLPTSPETKDL